MLITLIGFRGVGKSSVAPALADRLALEWIDADAEIERQSARTIPQIFAESGEPHFREIEANILRELLFRDGLVIASGGGAVLSAVTRERMRTAGPVVWLRATEETIWSRIGGDLASRSQRPALTTLDPRDELRQTLAIRRPIYTLAATITIDTDDRTVAEVVDEIVARLPLDEEPIP